eukprot:864046_1
MKTNVACNTMLIKTTQNNDKNKCCECLSNINGVKFALLLEGLMCTVAMYQCYGLWQQDLLRPSDASENKTNILILCAWFSAASCMAVVSGYQYLVGDRDVLCLKTFAIASIAASLVFILSIIWATVFIILSHVSQHLDEYDAAWDFVDETELFMLFALFVGLAILRVYGHINTLKCIKKAQTIPNRSTGNCCGFSSTTTRFILTLLHETVTGISGMFCLHKWSDQNICEEDYDTPKAEGL